MVERREKMARFLLEWFQIYPMSRLKIYAEDPIKFVHNLAEKGTFVINLMTNGVDATGAYEMQQVEFPTRKDMTLDVILCEDESVSQIEKHAPLGNSDNYKLSTRFTHTLTYRDFRSADFGSIKHVLRDIDWFKNKGKSSEVIYYDLSKAFDTVDHNLLLAKLESLGLRIIMPSYGGRTTTSLQQSFFYRACQIIN
ncbi:hypothetical protein ANCCEY_13736 [Ancylostoma ceylanicum]|uniref:Reverse transcriptase domain-containing protein n=1 Tax=Ancylostoma ceylanicum TaxID=53326 RepID=A0A0D6L699_9BILA|nr:hypothetical protein ANCCEY_13736 [Ancylostoma ceylanicum]